MKGEIKSFVNYCSNEKKLADKTLSAYVGDLRQFIGFMRKIGVKSARGVDKECMLRYVGHLSEKYKPKSVKRKVAVLKSMFSYFEQEYMVEESPFRRMSLRLDRGVTLPRSLPYDSIRRIVRVCADEHARRAGDVSRRNLLIVLLLSTTGMRVSEVCGIVRANVDVVQRQILINGKGNRERYVPLYDSATHEALRDYVSTVPVEFASKYLFPGTNGGFISDQVVRTMVRRFGEEAGIPERVTPHMFRHSIATYLLELGVDIRNIQALLGHSSISVTEIYTKVSPGSQLKVLGEKFPGVG